MTKVQCTLYNVKLLLCPGRAQDVFVLLKGDLQRVHKARVRLVDLRLARLVALRDCRSQTLAQH